MTVDEFIEKLPAKDKEVISGFREVILQADKKVKEGLGNVMSAAQSLAFHEQGIFKYAIAANKDYYSFHSMVIYASEKIMADLKSRLKKVRFQKGCVNFKSLEDFPLEELKEHMKLAATFDFSVVINHYEKKKKK